MYKFIFLVGLIASCSENNNNIPIVNQTESLLLEKNIPDDSKPEAVYDNDYFEGTYVKEEVLYEVEPIHMAYQIIVEGNDTLIAFSRRVDELDKSIYETDLIYSSHRIRFVMNVGHNSGIIEFYDSEEDTLPSSHEEIHRINDQK